jgi:NosR/NirI family transcriptional regulator, nitrous oxide reductase regulator
MVRRWVGLIAALFPTIPAFAVERFPPPEFESGYTFPTEQLPGPVSGYGQFLDMAVLLVALAGASWLVHRRRSRRGVFALALACLAYFGFYRHGCICAIGSIQNISLALFDSGYGLPLGALVFFALPLLFALFFGRVFCASVCPLGAIQEAVLLKPVHVPVWLDRGLRILPYIYLAVAVLFAATGSAFLVCRYDPFVGLFRRSAEPEMLALGLAFLLVGLVVGRPYCRWLCPYGVLLGWFAAFSRKQVSITPQHCVQCHLCRSSCPYGALHESSPEAPAGPVRAKQTAPSRRWVAVLVLVLFLPGLIAVAASAGRSLAPWMSGLHPKVSLEAALIADDSGEIVDEDLIDGFAHLRLSRRDLTAQASLVKDKMRIGATLGGGFCGLVAGLLVLFGLRRRRYQDYVTDAVDCVACARCFDSCPVEDDGGVRERVEQLSRWRTWARPATIVAIIAVCFVATVSAVVVWQGRSTAAITDDNPVSVLKKSLVKGNDIDKPVAALRTEDRQVREEFFYAQTLMERAGWLLLFGILVALLAARTGRKRAVPEDEEAVKQIARQDRQWRQSLGGTVTGSLAVFAVLSLLVVWFAPLEIADEEQALQTVTVQSHQWPRFLGPEGSGRAVYSKAYPTRWNGASGDGICWRAEVPMAGHNSPIVAEGRVFMSGATADVRAIMAFDLATGKLLWKRPVVVPVRRSDDEEVFTNPDTGFAAPTMVAHGKAVFAVFFNGDVGAFSLDGEQLWTTNLGSPDTAYGYASSLEAFDGKLFVQFDQLEDSPSRLFALDTRTGTPVWWVDRPVSNSWATPVLITGDGGPQLVTAANPWVLAYDPTDGNELWRAELLGGDVAPSPVRAGNLLLVIEPRRHLTAMRLDGRGDITASHKVWSFEQGIPDVPTPVADEQRVYVLASTGRLAAVRLSDGERLWKTRKRGLYRSSPALAGGKLYITEEKGVTTIFAAADELKELGTATLGEKCYTSPAMVDGRFYLRGEKHLFCIGAGHE